MYIQVPIFLYIINIVHNDNKKSLSAFEFRFMFIFLLTNKTYYNKYKIK